MIRTDFTCIPALVFGELSLRADWKEFMRVPVAPKNWKDPSKISDFVGRKSSELEGGAWESPWMLECGSIELYIPEGVGVPEGVTFDDFEDSVYNWRHIGELCPKKYLFFGPQAPMLLKVWSLQEYGVVWKSAIQMHSMETWAFTEKERKSLLTEKLLAPFFVGSEFETYMKAAEYFFNAKYTWSRKVWQRK